MAVMPSGLSGIFHSGKMEQLSKHCSEAVSRPLLRTAARKVGFR
jgi:hypothetical protein